MDVFNSIKNKVLSIDPVHFCENYLTLDGKPFRLNGNGYKPFSDIYRYIGIKALEPNSKPLVFVKGRQVGGTTMACALELFFMSSGLFGTGGRYPIRVMHCFPLLELGYMYTKTKLNLMMRTSKSAGKDRFGKEQSYVECKLDRFSSSNDSLQFKQFENGNHLFIESTSLTGDRLRGFTADCIFYDETQDIPGVAISNSTKILSQAKYGKVGDGVQVYFGTPKQKGSEYHKIWMSSSRQYYHLGCEECKAYFPLYVPESNDWETIWIDDDLPNEHPSHGFIVKCTHCGHEQDKRDAAERGKWVPLNDNKDTKFIGYHLNQLYMPHFTRDKIIGEKPDNHPTNTERAYQNDVLGEFFTGDASPITVEEIHKFCSDINRKFVRSISVEENKKVYIGCDWGEKVDPEQLIGDKAKKVQGQSYSSVVVLSVEGPELLSINYATLLKRNDPEYKKALIDQLYRQYSITLGVGDIGHAYDLTKTLQQEYGDRFLASRALGSTIKHHVKYIEDLFPKEIHFERNFYIEEIFGFMKKGKIRFPYGSYEQVGWLVQQCASMEMKGSLDRSGNIKITYVKGSIPNDGFMALLNAYLAYKFDATDGFKNIHPSQMDHSVERKAKQIAILGNIPLMNSMRRYSKFR